MSSASIQRAEQPQMLSPLLAFSLGIWSNILNHQLAVMRQIKQPDDTWRAFCHSVSMLTRLAFRTWAEADSPGRSVSSVVFLLLRAEFRPVSGIRRQRGCRSTGLRCLDPLRPKVPLETGTLVSGVVVRTVATHSWKEKYVPRWMMGNIRVFCCAKDRR